MSNGFKGTLDQAFQDAWSKVPDKRKVYEATIHVKGTNPINGYRVNLKSTGEDAPPN